jgi:glutamate-ammonia-ligase adenylyltransferase
VEFTVQLLALQHDVRSPGTMVALGRLAAIGAVSADDAAALREAYAFCERTRNRWYLVSGAAGDALPQDPLALDRLARSLGRSGSSLRNEYRRVTRRSRLVVQRLFYGVDSD